LRAKGGIACACSGNRREVSIAPHKILIATTTRETRVDILATPHIR
jgi:hypothetical protein